MKKAICLGILSLALAGGLMAQMAAGTNDSKSSSSDKSYNLVPESTVTVTTPSSNIEVGANFTVPVNVSDTTGRGIIAYQFDLHYNPTVIQPQANPVDVTGTLSSGLIAVYNPISPGILKVAVYGAYPLTGAGTLINFKFTAVGPASSMSQLTWVNFMFNEGNPGATVSGGQIALIPKTPTVVATSFSGRETVSGRLDVLNNVYRDNAFVLVSDSQTSATSMTVSLNLAPAEGQPGVYNVVSGQWTMMFYNNGNYIGSLYGEISQGRICDVVNSANGEILQRKGRGRFQIMGGMGSYENIRPEEMVSGEFVLRTDYTNGKRATATFTYAL